VDLVNVQSGAVEAVPDAQAQSAVTSGKYTFAAGTKVPIRTDVGRLLEATPEEAFAHLQKGTGTLASDHELAVQQHETAGSYAAAAGEGLARGAMAGFSDPVAIAAARTLGGDEAAEAVRRHLVEQREFHPYVAGAGEVVGAVAPALLSGGGSAAAEGAGLARGGLEAATALPRALAGAGGAVERGVAAILPEAESMVGRAAAKAASGAAGAAVENAGWAVGHAVDEDALNGGNTSLTAEQLLAAAGHGALLGGPVGGATHGLLSLGREALAGTGERMTGFLREQADRQASRAVGVEDRAAADVGGPAAVGRTLHSEGIFGGSLGEAAVKAEELAPRVEAAKAQTAERIASIIEKSDATMPVSSVVKPIDDLISSKLAVSDDKAVTALQGYRDDFLRKLRVDPEAIADADVPIRDIFRERQALGAALDKAPAELRSDLSALHKQIADREVQGIEEAGGMGGELLALQTKYSHLEIAQRAIAESESRASAGAGAARAAGWAGGAAGAAVGGMLGGGTGAFVGRSVGRDLAQSLEGGRGGAASAFALDKLHHLVTADQVVQDVTKRIDSGLRGYVSRTVEAVTRGASPEMPTRKLPGNHSLAATYDRKAEQIRALTNPALAHDRLTESIGTLASHAPKLAGALSSLATSDAQYLATILPPRPPPSSLLQPHLKQQPPSEAEMAKFLRLSSILDKPLTAIDKLRKGTLLQDEADLLRDRRPGLFGQIQESAMRAIAGRSTELPHPKRVALGVLLGIPTEASQSPDFVATMQASWLGRDEAPKPMHSDAKLNLVHPSEMDKIQQGEA
jgi:hypothetical protein